MKSKRARIEEKISQAAAERKQKREEARTSQLLDQAIPRDEMGKILGMPNVQETEATEQASDLQQAAEDQASRIATLILKEGLKGTAANFTKYPNEIHDLMAIRLDTCESIAYMLLWRDSWGFGRNYCRIGYSGLLERTTIKSRNSAIGAIKGLKEKKFIALILNSNGRPFTNQAGTIYRIFTPYEINSGNTEEGIPLSGIPQSGIPGRGIPENHDKKPNEEGIPQSGIPQSGIPGRDSTTVRYTGIPQSGIPQSGTPEENMDITGDHVSIPQSGIPQPGIHIKKDTKDTLSPDLIIDLFYTGIGQGKISNEKREKAGKCIQELQAEGFKLDQIAFAAEWTPANTKKQLYDFAIIKHTIGQAIAAMRAEEELEAKKRKNAEIQAQKQAEELRIKEEEARIKAYKESLPASERERLRSRAEADLKDSGKYNLEFITEALVAARENELLWKENDSEYQFGKSNKE